jgi:transcriptional regulator with XRE-family HTH domain
MTLKEQIEQMERVDIARKQQNLTIRDICNAVDITEGTYNNAKFGKRSVSYSTVIQLCKVVNINHINI